MGRGIKVLRIPAVIGYLLAGVLLGPSLLDILNEQAVKALSFLPNLALSFVAISIGIELSMGTFKKLGNGIITLIFTESLVTFALVCLGIGGISYLVSRNFSYSLAFGLTAGAVASASGPSSPIAVIQEYKAKGNLTSAIFAVVGFDDAVGIIIFSFAATVAKTILAQMAGVEIHNIFYQLGVKPFVEVGLSFLVGALAGVVFFFFSRKVKEKFEYFALLFALIMGIEGLSSVMDFSLILADMVLGMFIVNRMNSKVGEEIKATLSHYMPLIFILFFVFAGGQLQIKMLPAIGLSGLGYLLFRGFGKFLGAKAGSTLGRLEEKIKKYLWMGLFSQVGIGVGLTLAVISEYSEISPAGKDIGLKLLTIVTATSLIFELVGPWFVKKGLEKAGEIKTEPAPSRK